MHDFYDKAYLEGFKEGLREGAIEQAQQLYERQTTEINVEDLGITLKEVSQMFEDVTREYLVAIDKKVNERFSKI